ncbi:MAG: hypothetical protein K6U80_14185 [Firmicutes bacterium]|nr:hypothetical protein [Bacillota bacterium]
MPYYYLSLNTDQPVAIKTRIFTKGVSGDSIGNGPNSDEGKAPAEAVPADELFTAVQLLQVQALNLGKSLETLSMLSENLRTILGAPRAASRARRVSQANPVSFSGWLPGARSRKR